MRVHAELHVRSVHMSQDLLGVDETHPAALQSRLELDGSRLISGLTDC